MLRILVYKFKGMYYIYPLGSCECHQTKEDVFLEGSEEEVFTLTHLPNTPPLETLRRLMAELDRHGIKEVEGLTIVLENRMEDDLKNFHAPQIIH